MSTAWVIQEPKLVERTLVSALGTNVKNAPCSARVKATKNDLSSSGLFGSELPPLRYHVELYRCVPAYAASLKRETLLRKFPETWFRSSMAEVNSRSELAVC